MAKEAVAQTPATAPHPMRRASPFWISITVIILGILAAPTVIFVLVGMVPTIVAFVIDRSPKRYATFCVGGMNFSGVFFFLLDLWSRGGHTIAHALDILSNVFALAVMFSAAGFGWLLFVAIPPVVATFLTVMAQRRVAYLRIRQREIIEEWGEDVAASAGAGSAQPPRMPPT
jgi:hypothetical protein